MKKKKICLYILRKHALCVTFTTSKHGHNDAINAQEGTVKYAINTTCLSTLHMRRDHRNICFYYMLYAEHHQFPKFTL